MKKLNTFLLFTLLLLSCGKEGTNKKAEEHTADKTIQEFEVVETVRGKILWRLQAKRADISGDTSRINDVNLSFYDLDEKISSILTADAGYVFPSGDMLAKGNVVVISMESGRKLFTETLSWKQEKYKIVSDDSVTIFTEDGIIKGDNFESNPNLTEIKIREMRAVGEDK